MVDFLDEKRKEIDARLQELRPLVDQYNRLKKAASALSGVGGGTSRGGGGGGSGTCNRNPPTSQSGARTRNRQRQRRGRRAARTPARNGTRGKQALKLVKAKPGITIAELADAHEHQGQLPLTA